VTVFEGKARKAGGTYEVDWAEGQPPFRVRSGAAIAEGQTCHVAIRPEKVEIHGDRPDDANVLRGRVVDIGYLGNLSTYHVELGNGQIIRAQSFNTERDTRRRFTWEDEVWVNWTETCAVLLER